MNTKLIWIALITALVQRLAFFFWGLYQDAHMVPKFTDIDYMVFTDAAKYVYEGLSPYTRATYRYTPLLAWILTPTAFPLPGLFHFGKVLFIFGDLLAGYLIILTLTHLGFSEWQALKYSSIWLQNPLVSAISARGSSEGLLGVIVISVVFFAIRKRYFTAGLAAGLAVHFKIYPFIYVPAILWNMGPPNFNIFVANRFKFIMGTVLAFLSLTYLMYAIYGQEYLQESWIHHLVRIDHRHNFSVYADAMYFTSANPHVKFHQWAFIPQLGLTCLAIPLAFARRDLGATLALQTIAFVAFNKVCTSQYFIWYIVLLPLSLPKIATSNWTKYAVLLAWVGTQAGWLYHAFQLEFLGQPTYFPQLFTDNVLFFFAHVVLVCWLTLII